MAPQVKQTIDSFILRESGIKDNAGLDGRCEFQDGKENPAGDQTRQFPKSRKTCSITKVERLSGRAESVSRDSSWVFGWQQAGIAMEAVRRLKPAVEIVLVRFPFD
jgi:hypothetical protein